MGSASIIENTLPIVSALGNGLPVQYFQKPFPLCCSSAFKLPILVKNITNALLDMVSVVIIGRFLSSVMTLNNLFSPYILFEYLINLRSILQICTLTVFLSHCILLLIPLLLFPNPKVYTAALISLFGFDLCKHINAFLLSRICNWDFRIYFASSL